MDKKQNEEVNFGRFRYFLETQKNIFNLTVIDEINIDNNISTGNNKSITFINCVFNFEFKIQGYQTNENYSFINCIFNQRFLVQKIDLKNLTFSSCTFHQYFSSKQLRTINFIFESCQFNHSKQLVIDQFKTKNFKFEKNEFNRDIQLIPKQADLISLIGGESKSTLTLSNRGNKNTINKLFLEFNSNHNTDFLLRNLTTDYIQIHGELKDSTLSINNIKLRVGIIKYFFNNGNVLINALSPLTEKSLLALKGVNLGNAMISSINFSEFSKIKISSCNLVDIVPINIKWCKSNLLKTENTLKDRIETYRQLKIVAQKNLDTPTKLMYYKYEMKAHLKSIRKEKGMFSDKFILFTNLISNNHGLNWFVAFCWLIFFSIIWYTLVKYSLNQTQFNPKLIINEIGRFISFMNPAHRFNIVFDVKKEMYSSNAVFFDSISRIFSSYLIYQLISAFRKYSKK
ncbi:hypothetical protein [Psychroserpens ponticola]|uniref:Pentapeptide repeat-containing protein n=1 Tax=Psychroserpens ponticola TaxID=2932268 RepID=A0ABY7S2H3_9FLAO|nr:hypothetical protein [Psychroserpens ponticola]WCO03595.1 hypothetical protein MUN68_008810 [Psychroserpens ponticola]